LFTSLFVSSSVKSFFASFFCHVVVYLLSPGPSFSSYCSLNGEFDGKACVCDSGWIGKTCGTLDLLPVSAKQPGNGSTKGLVYPPPELRMSSWGGGIVSHGGMFHLYVSEMGGHCGLESWENNSLVRHAVSHTLIGPYMPQEMVQQAMSHNAYPVEHNGTFYIHHIGDGNSTGFTAGCTNGTTPPDSGNFVRQNISRVPAVLTGVTPSGPWVDEKITCDPAPCPTWSNPAVFIFPNGSTVLLLSMRTAKGVNTTNSGGFQVAKAPTPLGPFKPVLGDWSISPINTKNCEDSFVWVNERGYHAIFHCYGRPGGDAGGYAWSLDGRKWNTTTPRFAHDPPSDPELPFTDTVAQSDGSTTAYYQRQRPKLFLNDGTPAGLITGIDAKSKNHPEPWQRFCHGAAGHAMKGAGCDLTITHLQLIRQRPAFVAGDAAPNTTIDLMLPQQLTAVVSQQLHGATGDLQYVDLTAVAYSTTPIRSRRAVSAVSIVWGAGNSHGKKTLDQALQLVDSAVTQWSDVDIVLFPECFLYNGSNAETIEHGAIVTAMQKKAAEHKIYLIVPIYELLQQGQSQDGPTFNTAVLLGRNGSVVGKYHKHFPTTYEMDANVIPGSVVPVFDLDFGRIAMLICWDFNFPEVWHAVAAQDVDVVFWPSAAKGAENVMGHAMDHNYFIVANGLGQFYNRVGAPVNHSESVNVTLKADPVLSSTAAATPLTSNGLKRISAIDDGDHLKPPSNIVLLTKASIGE
jgi:predicted amidohydrolase